MSQNGHPRESHSAEHSSWRILAEEATQEQDPEKMMEIISALTRALDEEHDRNNRGS